jgi:hypothetical protein
MPESERRMQEMQDTLDRTRSCIQNVTKRNQEYLPLIENGSNYFTQIKNNLNTEDNNEYTDE